MSKIFYNERWQIDEQAKEDCRSLFGLEEYANELLLVPLEGSGHLLEASIISNRNLYGSRFLSQHYTIGENDQGLETGDYIINNLFIYYSDNSYSGWIHIPSNIKNITIISENSKYRKGYYSTSVKIQDIRQLRFDVSEDNVCYSSDEEGSLYNYDKTKLIHFYEKESYQDIVLPENIIEIESGAFYNSRINKIVFPKCFSSLKSGSLNDGYFGEIDFLGQLSEIEPGALERVSGKVIKINGLLAGINEDGIEELKKWKSKDYKNELIFLAPEPTYGRVLEDGYIELTKVLTTNEKLLARADSDKVCINSYINEQFEDRTDFRIPIIWDSLKLDYNDKKIDSRYSIYRDIYSPTNVTRIVFVADTKSREGLYEVLVHESEGKVKELIHKSYQKAKRR